MKKMINDPNEVVLEMLEGFALAYPNIVRMVEGLNSLVRIDAPVGGKVVLISGGGSGHEPTHGGFVGKGMLDGACAGDVFTSPTANQIFEVMKLIDGGKGILQIVKNFSGDTMNFGIAAEMARDEGIEVEAIIVNDDVAVEDNLNKSGRRGIAGTIFVHKIAGAAAEAGRTLKEVKRIAENVNANVRSMGIALTPCTPPSLGHPIFFLNDNEMEIGVGIHGELGIKRTKLMTANETVDTLMEKIFSDLTFNKRDEVSVIINGLGGTPLMELFIMNRRVSQILKAREIKVFKTWVGEFITSLDMSGASITLLKLDEELKTYLNEPADTVAWRN